MLKDIHIRLLFRTSEISEQDIVDAIIVKINEHPVFTNADSYTVSDKNLCDYETNIRLGAVSSYIDVIINLQEEPSNDTLYDLCIKLLDIPLVNCVKIIDVNSGHMNVFMRIK